MTSGNVDDRNSTRARCSAVQLLIMADGICTSVTRRQRRCRTTKITPLQRRRRFMQNSKAQTKETNRKRQYKNENKEPIQTSTATARPPVVAATNQKRQGPTSVRVVENESRACPAAKPNGRSHVNLSAHLRVSPV